MVPVSIETVLEFIDRVCVYDVRRKAVPSIHYSLREGIDSWKFGRMVLKIFCVCPRVRDEYTGVSSDSTLIFTNPLTILNTWIISPLFRLYVSDGKSRVFNLSS